MSMNEEYAITSFEKFVEFVREHDRLKGVAWEYVRLCKNIVEANQSSVDKSIADVDDMFIPAGLGRNIVDVALDR